jgi:hypothetical protein
MSASCEKPAAPDRPQELPEIDSLWNYRRPAESEAAFRRVLEGIDSVNGHKLYRAELLTQLARSQGLQQQFDAGHQTLDSAQALLDSPAPRVEVRALLERGRLFNSAGEPAKAAPFFHQAFDKGRAAGLDFFTIDAAHMLGICLTTKEDSETPLQWNLRALDAAEKSTDPRARNWMGSLLNNIG